MKKIATRRGAGLLASLGLITAVLGGIASAHTHVAESSPAAGARVDAAPTEVSVRFGDEMLPFQPAAVSDARLEVIDACGDRVDKDDSSLTMQDSKVVASSGGDVAGRYEIHWFATAADGAAQSGSIDFFVSNGESCTQVVRKDPAKDVDLGLDVVSLDSRRVNGGALLNITTAAPVACGDLTEKQGLELRFDTNADQLSDVDGELVCKKGDLALRLSDDDGVTGTLRVTRTAKDALSVKIARHVLLGHVDVYVDTSLDSAECEGKVCADRAPDLGSLRAY